MHLILETERLRLTPLAVDDVELAVEMFTSPAVMRFLGDLAAEDEIREEMPLWTKRGGNGCIGIWCVSDRVTSEKLGSAFLLPMPIDEDDTDWNKVVPGVMPDEDVEIGYFFKEGAWGKGYATEACRRLVRFAFEETPLQEVVATLDDDNHGSKRVLTKSGFTQRGIRRAYGQDNPDWRISREEWAG